MSNESSKDQNIERRNFIKAIATVPIFGFFLANLWLKLKKDALKRENLLKNFDYYQSFLLYFQTVFVCF